MRQCLQPLALALSAATPLAAQMGSNDTPLHNGGDTWVFLSSPSVGSDPRLQTYGDLFWRAFPGDRLTAHENAAGATMEIDGFYERLYDTDWSTTPSFYTRMVGPATASPSATCALEPAFFQKGLTSEVRIVFGASGFPNPCTVAPSLCSPPGGICPPPGFINGYLVDLALGSTPGTGIVLPADGTRGSDFAITYLLEAGMSASGGTCGLGDYDQQAFYSTDETQFDDCGGLNAFSGRKVGAAPRTQDAITDTPALNLTWRDPMLNAIADSGGGLGVEVSDNGGGALNGLKLDTSTGLATIGFEVRDLLSPGDVAVVWGSKYAGGPPGQSAFGGASLLVRPTREIPGCFTGPMLPVAFVFTSERAFATCQIPVQPLPAATDFYWQGLVYDPATDTAANTNRLRTTLY
ncbi:MAG: hypothetical protein AAF682_32590 [Planctomycetota bacterium]